MADHAQQAQANNLVPHFVLAQFAKGEENGRFHAATLFLDITESLMDHGQHGAEVLFGVLGVGVGEGVLTAVSIHTSLQQSK